MVRVGGIAALVWLAATGMAAASDVTLMINSIEPIELRLNRLASDPVTDPSKRFTAWIGGNGVRWHNRQPGLRNELQEVAAGGGLDYRILDTLTLGIGITHEDTHGVLIDSFGSFDRVGWGITPYLAWTPIPHVTLSASAGWAEFDNRSVTGAGGLGRYDTDRRHATAGAGVYYPVGAWRFGASARYLWLRETDEAFTTTGGGSVPRFKRDIEQGRATVSLGYDFGGFKPFIFGGIEHEFEQRRSLFVGTRRVDADDDGWLVGGGVDFALAPFQGTLRYVAEKGRSDQSVSGGNAKRLELSLELPF